MLDFIRKEVTTNVEKGEDQFLPRPSEFRGPLHQSLLIEWRFSCLLPPLDRPISFLKVPGI